MRRRADLEINRSQRLVLGFFIAVTVSLAVILAVAPSVYVGVVGGDGGALELGFLTGLLLLIALLCAGVILRWRWTFWLIVIAFLAGVLRVPASALELAHRIPASGPTWYVIFQAIVGLFQLGIGTALLAGYRKAGVWGAF